MRIGLVVGGLGVATRVAVASPTSGDYSAAGPVAGDNAGPALDALVHGNLGGVIAHQPLMGLTSILWRAPISALSSWLGAGQLRSYQIAAVACMLPAVLLATWLITRRDVTPTARRAGVLFAAIVLAGPSTVDAIHLGHPEEVLAATLATGAVVAAMGNRRAAAAVLLGLAIGTKQWAVLAAIPVLLTLREGRVAVAAGAAALALVLGASLPLADPHVFATEARWSVAFTSPTRSASGGPSAARCRAGARSRRISCRSVSIGRRHSPSRSPQGLR
jgi:hypothetical protein